MGKQTVPLRKEVQRIADHWQLQIHSESSLVTRWYRICLPILETWALSLGQEDPLEKEMAAHTSILAWEIPWTGEPGGLQSVGSRKIRT